MHPAGVPATDSLKMVAGAGCAGMCADGCRPDGAVALLRQEDSNGPNHQPQIT